MVRSSCVLAVSLLTMVASTAKANSHRTVDFFKFKGKALSAVFVESSDCGAATTTIQYNEQVIRTDEEPRPAEAEFVFVDVSYDNLFCDGRTYVLNGFIDQAQANFNSNLKKASVSALVPVSDGLGFSTTLHVNLRWEATGPVETNKTKFKSKDGGVKMVSKSSNSLAPAEARGNVTGIFPDGRFHDLVLAPSFLATMATTSIGEMTITKND